MFEFFLPKKSLQNWQKSWFFLALYEFIFLASEYSAKSPSFLGALICKTLFFGWPNIYIRHFFEEKESSEAEMPVDPDILEHAATNQRPSSFMTTFHLALKWEPLASPRQRMFWIKWNEFASFVSTEECMLILEKLDKALKAIPPSSVERAFSAAVDSVIKQLMVADSSGAPNECTPFYAPFLSC